MRVTSWRIERDREKESAIAAKVEAARNYYTEVVAEFDLTHRPPVAMAEAA
jgi:hypothetical protein